MEYDTFINSAFILQGRVDEFTKKTPHKRKEILAEILDLSRYDQLADLAKDRHKTSKVRQQTLEEQITLIEGELQFQTEYEQKLTQIRQALVELDANMHTYETRRRTLEQQQADLRGRQAQLQDRSRQKNALHDEAARLKDKHLRQHQQLIEVQAVLVRQDQITQAYQRYLELRQPRTL